MYFSFQNAPRSVDASSCSWHSLSPKVQRQLVSVDKRASWGPRNFTGGFYFPIDTKH